MPVVMVFINIKIYIFYICIKSNGIQIALNILIVNVSAINIQYDLQYKT